MHRPFFDDFGRASIFEAFLGPIEAEDDLVLRIAARDRVGNIQTAFPVDATVLLAPPGAERLITPQDPWQPDGGVILGPERLVRTADWLRIAEPELRAGKQERLPTTDTFEMRRISDMRALLQAFTALGLIGAQFTVVDATIRRAESGRAERSVLMVGAWR
jgi:hypothetical protein